MDTNIEWLKHRIDQYRANKTDACEAIDDFNELDKLGQGFTLVDPLEQVDIGDSSMPQPTFINQNLEANYKFELITLLKEYVDCFAWNYTEMFGLSRELVEHWLPIKDGFKPYKHPRRFNSIIYNRVKEEINRLLQAGFIQPCRWSGSLILCLLRRKILERSEYTLILEI
jgi:hypothetical protein